MNGFWERAAIAFRCFFSILFHGDIPNDIVQKRFKPAGQVPQTPAAQASVSRPKEMERPTSEAFDRAVQMLALLQRDGRLIDFLAENISPYPDAQLGAAVRTRTLCKAGADSELRRGSTGDRARRFRSGSHQIARQCEGRAADSRCVTTQGLAREGGESAAVAAGFRPYGDCAG